MLYFNRLTFLKESILKKQLIQKKCNICSHRYFLDKRFNFQTYVCNGWHDVLMLSINLSDIAILNIRSVDHRCIISGMSKSEAINLMLNIDFSEKKKMEHYKT